MTKTESWNDIEVDELPPWDDTEAAEPDELEHGGGLVPYSYGSEQRTLVGIGPLGRGRRSRPAAAPNSERIPQSEPPGPFVADEDETPAWPRGRKFGKRAVAVSLALLVPLAAVGVVRRLSSSGYAPSESPRVAAAQPQTSSPRVSAQEAPAVVVTAPAQQEPPALEAPRVTETKDSTSASSMEKSKEHRGTPLSAEPATTVPNPTMAPTPLPVKLAELAGAPTLVDLANGDANAGTVSVAATPPANVVFDGRPLGKSPRLVRATAGAHTLVFIHPLYGRRSLSVNVQSGATIAATAEF